MACNKKISGKHGAMRPGWKRSGVVAAVVAVLASYAVVGPVTSAFAASVSGSNFEIDTDANLTVDGGAGSLDWLTGGAGSELSDGAKVKDDVVSGSTDDSFTEGTKEDDTTPTVDSGSIPNNKSDLKTFGVSVEKTATKTFLNVFWTRVLEPNGTTNVDFEFNQSALTFNKPVGSPQVIPVRTAGDLLLTYDLSQGGSHATISKRIWSGSEWGAASALDDTQALGTINDSAITAANSGGLGGLSARTFGEASIDLAALIPTSEGCTTFGSAYVKSRSSDSFSAELKDFIAPKGVSISNCGAVKIHKTDTNGPLSGAGFTLFKDTVNGVVAGTCTTGATGDCTITDVKKGTYWLVETTVPAGHDKVQDQQVSITAGGQVVEVTLDDPIQKGTITVTKVAVPKDDQDFSFSLDTKDFLLDDDSNATLPSTRSFTVPVGAHTVNETDIPSGWVLSSLSCTDPTDNTTTNGPTATIALAKNETVACIYTDTFTKLGVHLQTQVAAGTAAGTWNDGATLTGDGMHPITGSVAFFACPVAAVATACTSDGTAVGAPAAVTGAGSAFTASTTEAYTPSAVGWTCFRAEFTSTSGFYANSTHSNATTECFLKQAQNLTVTKTATAAYGRVYRWTIDKAVDDSSVSIPEGGTAISAYTVTVGNSHVDGAWTVAGSITVTNPNPVEFTGVTVTDAIDNGAGNCAVSGGTNSTVPPNAVLVLPYTCTYTSAPSPSLGTNTASAAWSGTTYFTPASSASGTAGVNFATVTPSVTDPIVVVTDTTQTAPLGTIDARSDKNPTVFHYTVARTGTAGTCTDYPNTATFTAAASTGRETSATATTGSASASVRVCVGADLTVETSGSGTYERDYLWAIEKSVDKNYVAMPAGDSAAFEYQVTATPYRSDDSNFALSGVVTVINPNMWEDVTATVTEASDVGGGVTCYVTDGELVVVPAGGRVRLAYTCYFGDNDNPAAGGHVTGTATWDATTASTPSGSATASSPVSFDLVKETHKTVTVLDDMTVDGQVVILGTVTFGDGPKSFRYTVHQSGVEGECRDYTNTAKLVETAQTASKTVTVCVGLDLTVKKTALATDHRTYLWRIDKSVDNDHQSIAAGDSATFTYDVTVTPNGMTDDGWSVTGQITVTNPNRWEAVAVDVTDVVDSGGGADCRVGDGVQVEVPIAGSITLDYVCTFSSEPSDGINTATATWDGAAAATRDDSATGTAEVVFVPTSSTNATITVVDDKTDPQNPVTLGTATFGENPTTYSYPVSKEGVPGTCTTYTNTAVIQETEQQDSQDATLCVGQDLTAAVTAGGSFVRDDLWSIDKAVDRTTVTAVDGTSAAFTYTVTVIPGEVSDSGYALDGTVTVTNPNDWEGVVSDATVTTDLGGGATCTVSPGDGAPVPASGSVTRPYSCTFTGVPAVTGTVTATVTWDAEAAKTPTGRSIADTSAELVLATEGHSSMTVTDDRTDPQHPVTLGTAIWTDGPRLFTYTLTKTAVGGSCTTYTNTAMLVETEQSASLDVEVCGTTLGGGNPVVPQVPPSNGGITPVINGDLPFTGDMNGMLARWALTLMAAGGVLALLARRRSAR